jgi:hypothetical protein
VGEAPGPVSASQASEVTAAGLPRRMPTTPEPDTPQDAPPLAPSPRPPDQVFELVARFEAGRRRVQGGDEPEGRDSPEPRPEPGADQPEETP